MFSDNDILDSRAKAGRDAVEGLAGIAAALEHGVDVIDHASSRRWIDMLAIALGWLVLVTIILYPAFQLAAIAICVAFFGMRSFGRLILGPPMEPMIIGRSPSPGRLLAA